MFEELELEVARQLLLDSVKKIDTERVFLHQAHSRYLIQNNMLNGFPVSTTMTVFWALDTGASRPISIRIIKSKQETQVIKPPEAVV